MPILLKLFQKIAEEGTHFQTDSTRAPSPDTKTKDNTQKRKLQANITHNKTKMRLKFNNQKSPQNYNFFLKYANLLTPLRKDAK